MKVDRSTLACAFLLGCLLGVFLIFGPIWAVVLFQVGLVLAALLAYRARELEEDEE